ncbi:S-adenosyl-L-methionine-dependent methyltransferase [Bombardia bombarda]|uniref:S-adenosyl-L-methionine-dependent methyltransferase n=1 Tax=Bombardia bombarda TaxID=252184 RepID=A0AA40CB31_9PEZI|nr:S-adenosyl-L-methionine-dependent methyltransferase [Bombardia bombarda]
MALPTKNDIQALGYADSPDLDGYMSRVQIIAKAKEAKAKELVRALVTPDQLPNYHGLNMTELVAIRTFINLKVLEAIPKTGSISLTDLSKATGAQESLLDGGDYKHTKFSLAYLLEQPSPGHLFLALVLKNTPEEQAQGIAELVDVGGGHGRARFCPRIVQHVEHDFLTEQPTKRAKAYFMRMILHDYADSVSIEILKRLSAAMSPASRVLVCEMVLPSRASEADFPVAVLDLAVMTMGEKERTEQGFSKMLEAAGLELVKVWRVPGVPGACVEGRLQRL